jgi:putative Holliday junction resolvase
MKSKEIINYLGVDWGEKRIGLALAESETKLALPFKTVANISELIQVIKEEEISKIIIGVPFKMRDNKIKPSAQFSEFLDLLKSKTDLEIELVDERLSSIQADKLIGAKKDKVGRDEMAAMIILQSYLDNIYG